MKEGISEAHWTGLSEEKHSREGKAAMTELPKRWNDIWRILFPELPTPATPCKLFFFESSCKHSTDYEARGQKSG
jgi:hypothetical protein